jgi:hypothetical protein
MGGTIAKYRFGSFGKILFGIVFLILVGILHNMGPGFVFLIIILLLIGPGIAVPAILAAIGKTVRSDRDLPPTKKLIQDSFSVDNIGRKWGSISGRGELISCES